MDKLNQKPWTIEGIRKEMARYKSEKPELAEIMDLYEKIYAIEAEYLPKIDPKIEADDTEEINRKIVEGKNLLDTQKIYIDPAMFREILAKMADVLSQANPDLKEPLKKLVEYPDLKEDTPGQTPVFIDALLKFNTQYFTKIAGLIELNNDLMFFLIYHAVGPFIEKASYEYRDMFNYQHWQKTICPVCGRKPSMSILRQENGLQVLQCQVCRTQWSFPRVKCIVCENTDNETYKYFYDEADEAHRVYVCDKCKKYLKTTDCRKLERDVDIEVEDLATLVLDYVAKERGYEPGGRITFAVLVDAPEDAGEGEAPETIVVD